MGPFCPPFPAQGCIRQCWGSGESTFFLLRTRPRKVDTCCHERRGGRPPGDGWSPTCVPLDFRSRERRKDPQNGTSSFPTSFMSPQQHSLKLSVSFPPPPHRRGDWGLKLATCALYEIYLPATNTQIRNLKRPSFTQTPFVKSHAISPPLVICPL